MALRRAASRLGHFLSVPNHHAVFNFAVNMTHPRSTETLARGRDDRGDRGTRTAEVAASKAALSTPPKFDDLVAWEQWLTLNDCSFFGSDSSNLAVKSSLNTIFDKYRGNAPHTSH